MWRSKKKVVRRRKMSSKVEATCDSLRLDGTGSPIRAAENEKAVVVERNQRTESSCSPSEPHQQQGGSISSSWENKHALDSTARSTNQSKSGDVCRDSPVVSEPNDKDIIDHVELERPRRISDVSSSPSKGAKPITNDKHHTDLEHTGATEESDDDVSVSFLMDKSRLLDECDGAAPPPEFLDEREIARVDSNECFRRASEMDKETFMIGGSGDHEADISMISKASEDGAERKVRLSVEETINSLEEQLDGIMHGK